MKRILINVIDVAVIILVVWYFSRPDIVKNNFVNKSKTIRSVNNVKNIVENTNNIQIDDWRLTLVNYENALPDDFSIKLADIDDIRKFDKRAIGELFKMQKAMKKDGIYNVWVQSAYRSVKYQQGLFDEKVNMYKSQGKTQEEAESLTLQTINKPGTSEHNLGLAVDFNYVDYSFDETAGFKWLQKNAEDYGFILRYRKDKEEITKVKYEPWHWRYVGIEHAKQMKELDMCLEEYIEYLKK